jgi:hypothetical protein
MNERKPLHGLVNKRGRYTFQREEEMKEKEVLRT